MHTVLCNQIIVRAEKQDPASSQSYVLKIQRNGVVVDQILLRVKERDAAGVPG